MWWIIGALVAFVVLALAVDRRRGGTFGSGRRHGEHAAEGAAVAQTLRGPSSGSSAGPGA